jgi:isopentenyldiphosphate isomerase
MSTAAGDELVDVVDAAGRTVGTVTRREMRARRLPHRCAYVLVFNGQGELFIHLRTPTKDVYPSYWDATVGGVLAAGETFDAGARREVFEEIGVETEPERLFAFRYTDALSTVHGMVYSVRNDGPFRLQPEEVVRGEFVPLPEVLQRSKQVPFCPDSIAVLDKFRRRALAALDELERRLNDP